MAELRGVEVRLEQVEVERLAETLGARIARAPRALHPRLGDRGAGRVVLVEHRPPLGVDVVHVVAVDDRVAAVDRHGVEFGLARQRLGEILREHVGDVDAEAVDAAIRPEPQRAHEVLAHLRVVPVEVGLLDGEEVQVPLAVRDLLPRRAAEDRLPVGRRLCAVGAGPVAEDVAVARRRARRGGERLLEPLVQIRGVVRARCRRRPGCPRRAAPPPSRRSRRACRAADRRRGSRRRRSRRPRAPTGRTGSARPRRRRAPRGSRPAT